MKSNGELGPTVISFTDSPLKRVRRAVGGVASSFMLREIDKATELVKERTRVELAETAAQPQSWKPEWGYSGDDGLPNHVRIQDTPIGEVIELPLRGN